MRLPCRLDGTYPLIVIAPGSIAPAVIGRMAVWGLGWIVSSVLAFFIVACVFRWTFSPGTAFAALALIVLLCTSAFFFTVPVGALASLAPRIRNFCGFLVQLSVTAFSGVSVPVEFWPGWVQAGCHLLPVTHGLAALRGLLDGATSAEVLRLAGIEAAVGLGWLALGLLVIDRFAERGRAHGSIEFM